MTRKELIRQMVERLPDDVTYDQVLYRITIMQDVEMGLEQAARGEGIEHDELFAQLEAEDEEAQNHLDASDDSASQGRSRVHRKRSATDGGRVRKPTEKARRKA